MRRKRHVKSPSWAEQTLERNSEKKGGEKKPKIKRRKEAKTYMNEERRRRFGICPPKVIQFYLFLRCIDLTCASPTHKRIGQSTHMTPITPPAPPTRPTRPTRP